MYLSRITLDSSKRETARALSERGRLHSLIEDSFTGPRQHPLWRVDKEMGIYTLLIVSTDIPDLGKIEKAIGSGDGRTIPYDEYSPKIVNENEVLRFRISVNPTIRRSKDGATVPLNLHRTENQPYSSEDWVREKLKTAGVEVIKIEVVDFRSIRVKCGKGLVFKVTYDGLLKIADSEKFREAMLTGIGRKKAYGCGLITVMPC